MVRQILGVLYKEIKGLHQAAYIIAFFTLASQLLALVRDRVLAHQFGAGAELDIYYAAFRIPDLLFTLFASVLSVYVLLPFVTRLEERDHTGNRVVNQMMTLFLLVYLVVAIILFVLAPIILPKIFHGFAVEDQLKLTLLTRVMLLQPFFLGLSSLAGIITQLSQRFIIYAISPLLYNVGIIFGVMVLYPVIGISGLAWGVVLGAIGHLAVQLPMVYKNHFSPRLIFKFDWRLLREIAAVAIPRSVTLSLNQVLFIFLFSLASVMTVGSASVLQFAYNLQSVPLAIVGMSYSIAAFPTLTSLLSQQKIDVFNTHLLTAFRHIIFWSLPITGLVIVLRAQIARVLLGTGAFDWDDTRLTAAALSIFIITLVGQAISLLLIRAFYAGGYSKVPLIVTSISTLVGGATAWCLMLLFQQNEHWLAELLALFRIANVEGGEVLILPIGFSVATVIQVVLLLVFLKTKFAISYRPLQKKLLQAILATLAGSFAAYIVLFLVVDGINQNTFIGIFLQGAIAGSIGLLVVILTYLKLGSEEMTEIYYSFHARVFKTKVVVSQDEIL